MDPRYYSFLNEDLQAKIDDANFSIEDCYERIIELDGQKIPYDSFLVDVDNDVLYETSKVNDKILDVSNAYQDRINVGCRTDVFWRRISENAGIHTLVATQLSLSGYGNTLPTVEYFNGSGFSVYPTNSTFGFQSENLYGIKYYDEPITKDVGDTFVSSFIGAINSGSDTVTIFSTVGSSTTLGISTGQLVISSKSSVLPSSSNIIGIGTTSLDKSVLGITTGSTVNTLILDTTASDTAYAPESDGSYVTFTVLSSVSEFSSEDYLIQSEKDPYSPQTIGILDYENVGIGVSIKYDNSGNAPNVVSWDPNAFDEENPSTFEPSVGAGKYYYKVGFSSYPISLTGQRVAVGFTTTVTTAQLLSITTLCSTCPTQESNLTSAISSLNTAKSQISAGINTLNYKIDVANTFRDQRKEIQSQIWGLGQQISDYRVDIATYDKALNYLGVSTITNIVL